MMMWINGWKEWDEGIENDDFVWDVHAKSEEFIVIEEKSLWEKGKMIFDFFEQCIKVYTINKFTWKFVAVGWITGILGCTRTLERTRFKFPLFSLFLQTTSSMPSKQYYFIYCHLFLSLTLTFFECFFLKYLHLNISTQGWTTSFFLLILCIHLNVIFTSHFPIE